MSNVQFGTNTPALRKQRLYYTGTNTIYEGMPVCFDYDATTNVLGWDNDASQVIGTTTDEGYQNEGKFLRVEDPVTANLPWFAGVVAAGGYVGKAGPKWVDVYAPNGAIVPIRTYVSSTVGVTAVAIMNGTQYFGNPTAGMGNGAAAYVALCEETVDRSATAGLCLAKLDPRLFVNQTAGTAKMNFATAGTVDLAANFVNVKSLQTAGTFTGFFVRSEVTNADSGDVALAVYGEANVLGVTAGSYQIGNRFALNLWGGTQTASVIAALAGEIYEEGANLTGSTVIAPLFLRTQIDATNPPAANTHYMMHFRVDGADKPDGLFIIGALNTIGALASISDAPALAPGDVMIPVRLNGTTYYIPAMADSGQ